MLYCEDCKRNVGYTVSRDWIGDPDVINGIWFIEVWTCEECHGTELTDTKQQADPE